jgi:thiamine biosynthesis lipoprotein
MRIAGLLVLALLASHPAVAAPITEVHYVMGTYFQITAEHEDVVRARTAVRRCFVTARRLDELFSRFDAASELSRLNARADEQVVTVSAEMAALLRRALQLQGVTDGGFDVSVGRLTQLWRTATARPPATVVAAALHSGGAGSFTLAGRRLIRHPGVVIDLDGIAKGWAVDRCVQQLRADGIEHALLNFGESSLYAIGAPRGADGWPITLRGLDPQRALGVLMLRDQAVSISAVFGRPRRVGGRRIGHIIDPRSGQPLPSPAVAVVVAASATDAEAFSKALLIDASGRWLSAAAGALGGTLLITPHGLRRTGALPFTPFAGGRPIPAAAEALR